MAVNSTLADYKLQLIIIGDSGCGKTSFMDRYCDGQYRVSYNATVGIDFKVKTVISSNNKRVKLQIWDTAGQEKFNSITTAYYRNARGVVIMYDVTRANTFENVRKWLALVSQFGRGDVEIAIVGNKCDVMEMADSGGDGERSTLNKRAITKEHGEQLATENGCHFFECSAKEDINVAEVFTRLSEEIIRHMPIEQHRPNTQGRLATTYLSDNNNNKPPTDSSGCC